VDSNITAHVIALGEGESDAAAHSAHVTVHNAVPHTMPHTMSHTMSGDECDVRQELHGRR